MDIIKQKDILHKTFPFLTENDLIKLLEIGFYRKLNNREILIKQGQFAPVIIFILRGTIRGYSIDKEGEEKNMFLKPASTFTAAPDCLFEGVPTKYTFEAIQETHVMVFNVADFEHLATTLPNISQLYISGLKENVRTLIFRVEMLAAMSPEERYEALLKQNPVLFQTAFNKHIANYLGITPNSLSRIIKRKKEGG